MQRHFHNSLISTAGGGATRGSPNRLSLAIINLKCFVSFAPPELPVAVSSHRRHKDANADDSSGLVLGEGNDHEAFYSADNSTKTLLAFELSN